MKTFIYKGKYKDRKWFVVDASGKVLGRMATKVASILRGKHKPIYSPHLDLGDHIIVINASKVRLTGKKAKQKFIVKAYPTAFMSNDENWKKAIERILSDGDNNREQNKIEAGSV